ncbi:MAG: type II toxin-antitoxin system HicA family toxin [Candidatus Paceibacteria bacterium]
MSTIRPISWRKLSKIFELDGWTLSRIKGDHMVYTKDGFLRPVVIPRDSVVEVFIIKNNIKTAMISRERYFELLEKV